MISPQRQNRLRTMIQRSRARLMVDNPEFALVLMYLKYVATKQVFRISTNGRIIYFDPDWLQKLTGKEMDYILSHQVLHLIRDDVKRPAFFAGDRYHHACDIILNSFMRELGLTAEQYQHIGKLPHTTYFPEYEGSVLTPIESYRSVPFDPMKLKPGQRRAFRIDSDEWWGRFGMPEDGTLILYPGYKGLSSEVVRDEEKNGPVLHVKDLRKFGPPSDEPYDNSEPDEVDPPGIVNVDNGSDTLKDHDTPIPEAEPEVKQGTDSKRDDRNTQELDDAINRLIHMIENMEAATSKHEDVMDRILKSVSSAKLEWRKLLNGFLQEEFHDYSFQPPDRRFDDTGFFLPDFNERDEKLRDVLFLIDSSGSVEDEMLSIVYGELNAAIEQFNGKLTGLLSFFNTSVTKPIPFCTARELLRIKPHGYGGTDFGCIFRYIQEHADLEPSCIVIFTDGKGAYPPESAAAGIPVLWILHGNEAFPKWGCTARLI